jgi:hypothetical protein
MRFAYPAALLISLAASGQQAPPCTQALTGVLFDFGTREAPRLFKCDGKVRALWTPPPALCPAPAMAPAPAPNAPAPSPGPLEAPPPMPSLEALPPLPVGPPASGATAEASPECRRQCLMTFNQCIKTRCGMALAASCRQSCDRNQTKCVTGCP